MTAMQLSSGDLVVDRRAGYAEMLVEAGDPAAAADLLRDALALAPGWTAGWFRLGEMREAAGALADAADAWREALRLDPSDRLGATLKLALAGAAQGIAAPPSAFVETLFDQYAARFDASLVTKLGYTVPESLAAAIAATGRAAFAHVVDLGCGTGLMGERLRGAASFLEGVDISAGMLRKAEAKKLYDRLDRRDLQTWAPPPAFADLVVAADVFMYVGALERIVAAASAALVPGGLFAFSVEAHDGAEDMLLRASRRYAHSPAYVELVLAASGLAVERCAAETIRCDRGEPIAGLLVVARKLPAEALAALADVEAIPEPAALALS